MFLPESKKGWFVGDDSVPPSSIVLMSDYVVVHHVLNGLVDSVCRLVLLREGKVVLRGRERERERRMETLPQREGGSYV